MRTCRKKIIVGVILSIFMLLGIIANSSATTIVLPEPNQSYPDGTTGLGDRICRLGA